MKRIVSADDIGTLDDSPVSLLVKTLYHTILATYREDCSDLSIEKVGALFIIEKAEDLDDFQGFGLSRPLTEDWIEYCNDYGEYVDCCIILNNDYAVNLIGNKEYFRKKGLIIDEESKL